MGFGDTVLEHAHRPSAWTGWKDCRMLAGMCLSWCEMLHAPIRILCSHYRTFG
jgi:hypothetical protein